MTKVGVVSPGCPKNLVDAGGDAGNPRPRRVPTHAARRDPLMTIQRTIAAALNQARLGKTFTALLEGPSDETGLLWKARLAASLTGLLPGGK